MKRKVDIFFNAKIYTPEKEGECYAAMVVSNGNIVKLFEQVSNVEDYTNRYDMKGRTIIPSFSDAHLHYTFSAFVMGIGFCISEITPSGIVPDSLQGVRKKIAAHIESTKSDIILCYGYMIAGVSEERLPTRFELESWFPTKTISIISLDGHSSTHTTQVLKYAGMFDNKHDGILSGEDHEFNTGKLFGYLKKLTIKIRICHLS